MPAITPLQLPELTKEDIDSGNLSAFNQALSQVGQHINRLNGNAGPVTMSSGVDLGGSTIKNSGPPTSPNDLLTHSYAESKYSASAIAPQLEAGGSNSLKTVRRLGDKNQQEPNSTFLNSLMNTAPTVNDSLVTFGPVVSGGCTITISAGTHLYVDDQTSVSYAARTDTVTLPAETPISTISVSSSVATLTTTAAHNKIPGQSVTVSGTSDSNPLSSTDFSGTFIVTAVPSPTTLTYRDVIPNGSASGGTVASAGVYMYFLRKGQTTLSLAGPFRDDTQQNRLTVNVDGQVLIAVAVVTVNGGDPTQSSGGATSPVQTNGNHVLTRL